MRALRDLAIEFLFHDIVREWVLRSFVVADIGFIGLGLMGKPMSKRLIAAGRRLVVHNRHEKPAEELVKLGAQLAFSPREVAERSEIIITMLPDSSDVKDVILGQNGVAEGIKDGSLVIDCSTISPLVEVEIAQRLQSKQVEALDAPVTGGTMGAEAGTLTFLVGGNDAAYERALPLFKAMGKEIFHMGRHGAGSYAKLCNQICVGLNLLGTCEALTLAARAGLDPNQTIAALTTGAANSWQLANFGPKMMQRDFKPGFKIEHLEKDMRLASEMCEQLVIPSFGSSLVRELLKCAENMGFRENGTPALYGAIEKMAKG
jgi:3-hydroxyisobutyrate dehydrogenase